MGLDSRAAQSCDRDINEPSIPLFLFALATAAVLHRRIE